MLPDLQRWCLHRFTKQIQLCNIDTSITLNISSRTKVNQVYISRHQIIKCDSVKLNAVAKFEARSHVRIAEDDAAAYCPDQPRLRRARVYRKVRPKTSRLSPTLPR